MKFAHDIIRRPIISERSMEAEFDREGNEIKKYTFEVPVTANKIEIKKACEEVFGVKAARQLSSLICNLFNNQIKE